MAEDERTIHLFERGSFITLCCKRAGADARIQRDRGTYEPAAATCEASGYRRRILDEWAASEPAPRGPWDRPLDPEPDDSGVAR